MNRGELRTFIGDRFEVVSATALTRANNVLDLALATVWDADEWAFKKIAPGDTDGTLALAQNDVVKACTSAVGHVTDLFDHLGDPLDYLDEDTFDATYRADLLTPTAGTPDAYTIRDDGKGGKIVAFNKKLDAARTFTLAGTKSVHHRTSGGVVTAGLWNDDTDLPVWRDQHHLVVAYEAMLELMIGLNDPSYDPVAALRDDLLEKMRAAYVPDRPGPLAFRRRR